MQACNDLGKQRNTVGRMCFSLCILTFMSVLQVGIHPFDISLLEAGSHLRS